MHFTDVKLFSVDFDMLQSYFASNSNLMLEMFALLAQRVHFLAAQVYSMSFFSVDKKVAHILVQLGTYFKKEQYGAYSIDYTHEDLSGLIGTARTSTTKVLKSFEQKGWISLAYRNIIVLDEESLKEHLLS